MAGIETHEADQPIVFDTEMPNYMITFVEVDKIRNAVEVMLTLFGAACHIGN